MRFYCERNLFEITRISIDRDKTYAGVQMALFEDAHNSEDSYWIMELMPEDIMDLWAMLTKHKPGEDHVLALDLRNEFGERNALMFQYIEGIWHMTFYYLEDHDLTIGIDEIDWPPTLCYEFQPWQVEVLSRWLDRWVDIQMSDLA